MSYMDRELLPLPTQDVEANTKPPARNPGSSRVVEGDRLPPHDSGKVAYVFLIGACMIGGVSWGQYILILLLRPR